jgi:LytS/YehU family sensor histidine kinase
LTAFSLLNIFLLISWLEHFHWIKSSPITVYSENIGFVLQFIFLSIAITESIKNQLKERNLALTLLLEASEKNINLRLKELKQQMNPHFVFNALNSILSRILTDKKEDAARHLTNFSKLIRHNLLISEDDFIVLEDEISTLQLYLEIEQLRLGNSFTYQINLDKKIDYSQTRIPTFMLQTFVENAIWHGLSKIQGEKKLEINFALDSNFLSIVIEDNGLGIEENLMEKKENGHHSKGLQILKERCNLFEKKYQKKLNFTISNLKYLNKRGTIVTLNIEL